MMVDDLAFMRVICASPDDDGPRLLYADYLEEKGDPASVAQAEFIRVQCALNSAAPGKGNVESLRQRERTLLNEHWRTWLRPACQALGEPMPDGLVPRTRGWQGERYRLRWLPGLDRHNHVIEQDQASGLPYLHSAQFRRGFLAHAALVAKASRGERHVARLWDKAPLDGLTLVNFDPDVFQRTLSAIEPSRLRSLELIFTEDGSVVSVALCPKLTGLRELFVQGIQDQVDLAEVIGKSSTLQGLRILVFRTCQVEEAGISRLCQASFAASLERLDLTDCRLTNNGAFRLAREFPANCRLTHLDVSGNYFSGAGWRALRSRFDNVLKSHSGERPWPSRFYL